MKADFIKLDWVVGDCGTQNTYPEKFIKATVPGNVHCDFAAEYNYPDINVADNFHVYDWMEDHYFLYEAKLPTIKAGQKMVFRSLGIDYEYEILVNGRSVFHYEGMFKKAEIDITQYLTGNDTLGVLIYPMPTIENPVIKSNHVNQSFKPGVSYGWDFCPSVVPCGIWDDTVVIVTSTSYIADWEIDTFLNEDFTVADCRFALFAGHDVDYRVNLWVTDPDGKEVYAVTGARKEHAFTINNPKLWWPQGYGEPLLYTFRAEMTVDGAVVDNLTFKRGFKHLELVHFEGAWDIPFAFPIHYVPQPFTFKVNGRPIFIQGTNWVCPEVFPGILTREKYEVQLRAIRDINFNFIRCWGGAIINKEPFFELCDEYGLLIWQDFILACNRYEATNHYMSVLDSESVAIIKRLKKHTCLALWSGGNELFNAWSKMTMQDLALRKLDSNCLLYDPYTPFIPTTPISDIVHGDYHFLCNDGRDVIRMMNETTTVAYNEIGCPGAADMETIKYIIPEDELNRIEPGTSWETHKALNAWFGNSHLYKDVVEYYFGDNLTLQELVDYSRKLQAIGYKYIYEEARRQAPRCSSVLSWCFNEPWPNAANNNYYHYGNKPAPAYYAIGEACRTSMPSVRMPKFEFLKGETLDLEAWWLVQTRCQLDGRLALGVQLDGKEVVLGELDFANETVDKNRSLLKADIKLNSENTQLVKIFAVYRGNNGEEIRSDYEVLYRAQTEPKPFTPCLQQPKW